MVISDRGKGVAEIRHVEFKETNANEPLLKHRDEKVTILKPGCYMDSGISLEETYLLAKQYAVCRWREFKLGSFTERGKLSL